MADSTPGTPKDIVGHFEKLLNAPNPPDIPELFAQDEDFVQLHEKILALRDILGRFAKGDLSSNITMRGFSAGALKALQAHLRHLIWQVQQVEKGDFTQRIDFLGDFSQSFNSMVVQLDNSITALRQKEEALTHLAKTLQQEVELRTSAVIALKQSETKFKYLAEHDPLTGAYNRRSFFSHAIERMKSASMKKLPCCIALLDVDHFKQFNDTYGHIDGDTALKHIVEVGKKTLRQVDIMGRFGGEEFIFFFDGVDLDQGCIAAERIRESIAESLVPIEDGRLIPVTATIGVSVILPEWHTDRMDLLLQHIIGQADLALYEGKKLGRNRVSAAKPSCPELCSNGVEPA